MALFMGPLYFCKLVFITTMASALYGLLETSTPPHNLTMKAQGFEYILSWEPGNNTGTPTYYRVMYKPNGIRCHTPQTLDATQSKSPGRNQEQGASSNKSRPNSNYKTAKECSNITNLFCNLTKELKEFCQTYLIKVEQIMETETQKSQKTQKLRFNPYMETCVTPAWFSISACPNCINVTVKLSSPFLKEYYQLKHTVKVAKAGFTETLISSETREENFHTVVRDLSPNTNYCISVDVSSSVTNQCTPSAWKCLVTSSKDKPGLVAFPVAGGIVMMVLLVFSLFFLYATGFVCLREERPKVLNIPQFGDSLVELDPKVHSIQIIQKGKRKGTEYDSEDDCESNGENDGGYTNHGLLRKVSKSCSKADITEQLSIDSSSVASDCQLLDAETENLQCHTNEESTAGQVFCSASEVNFTSLPEPEIGDCLDINLNTVLVGIPDKNWDAAATLSPYQEDAADLQVLCVSDATEPHTDMQHPGVHNLSYAQQNSTGSGESESSDSETDCFSEYMRR